MLKCVLVEKEFLETSILRKHAWHWKICEFVWE